MSIKIEYFMAQYLYFSTQTWLAYRISKRYFGERFFVHCSDEFNPYTNPGSSNPNILHAHFRRVAERGDRGDNKVNDIKKRLKEVALEKLGNHELTSDEYDSLAWEVDHAETREFAPVVYLIQKKEIGNNQIKRVPPDKAANPDSIEYTITDLTEKQFDVMGTHLQFVGPLF